MVGWPEDTHEVWCVVVDGSESDLGLMIGTSATLKIMCSLVMMIKTRITHNYSKDPTRKAVVEQTLNQNTRCILRLIMLLRNVTLLIFLPLTYTPLALVFKMKQWARREVLILYWFQHFLVLHLMFGLFFSLRISPLNAYFKCIR